MIYYLVSQNASVFCISENAAKRNVDFIINQSRENQLKR